MNIVKVLIFLILSSGVADAAPLVEKYGRFEINWSTHRLRFFGYGDEGDFSKSEKAAWKDGLKYLVRELPQVLSKLSPGSQSIDFKAGERVASATYRVKTVYYSNGSARVLMESQLSRAFSPKLADFIINEPSTEASRNSKIVIRLDRPIRPSPLFKVIVNGETVYSYKSVAASSFRRGLVGSFFVWDKSQAPKSIVGRNPIVIFGKVSSEGIIVSEGDWRRAIRGNQPILSRAGIAVSFPGRG